MKRVQWEYICNWCSERVKRTVETAPDGWKLVLIGADDRGPNKWEKKRHICDVCYGDEDTFFHPKGVHPDADKD